MHDVVIIGAGIAGLYVNAKLREDGYDTVVLEARPQVGGRVRTVYDESGQVQYESGPWRIPKKHARMRQLCREHNIDLVPLQSPTPKYPHAAEAMRGLSKYDINLYKSENPHTADVMDQNTGYADQTFAESSTNPYSTSDVEFFIAPAGFSALTESMAKDANVRTNERVVDVTKAFGGSYNVHVVRRRSGNVFRNRVYSARAVFICVPPHVAKEWPTYVQHNRVHLSRVDQNVLQHIYVKGKLPSMHALNATSALVQTVSDSYGQGWYQASYTSGRVARFWYNLRLAFPDRFLSLLKRLLLRMYNSRVSEVASHHWPCAYHMWKPVPKFDVHAAVAASVCPNPIALPQVYWAGEAFSSFQAWMEGAIETADLAMDAFRTRRCSMPVRAPSDGEMVVENRIIGNLDEWAQVHPGGHGAIAGYLGKGDVTTLFRHINHSDHAYAVLGAHQVAWAKRAFLVRARPRSVASIVSKILKL